MNHTLLYVSVFRLTNLPGGSGRNPDTLAATILKILGFLGPLIARLSHADIVSASAGAVRYHFLAGIVNKDLSQ